jgi:SH3 domain protein
MRYPWLFAVIFWLVPLLAGAETVYVTDNLRIGVRPAPDNNAAPIGVVVSGTKMDVLKRSDDYVKIRSAEGIEGWIKEIHITKEAPVRLQLDQITALYQQVKKDADEKSVQLKTVEDSHGKLTDEVAALKKSNEQLTSELQATGTDKGSSLVWLWIAMLVLAVGGGSFYAGMLWHRQFVMKKLGGLRF